MTTHIANFGYKTGYTLTAQLFAGDSDTVAFTAASVTEATNRKNRYLASFSNVTEGNYLLIYFVDGTAAGYEFVRFAGTDGEVVRPFADANVMQVLNEAAVINTDVGTETKQDALLAAINATVAVSVLPATGIVAARAPGFTLTPAVGELIAQSITLYQTDGVTPYSLAGKSLAMVFEDQNGVDVAVIPNSAIAVSGASSNVITFNYTAPITSSERTLRAALKDDASPFTEYAKGLCVVTSGPRVDS